MPRRANKMKSTKTKQPASQDDFAGFGMADVEPDAVMIASVL
jgi:hypothetical protein